MTDTNFNLELADIPSESVARIVPAILASESSRVTVTAISKIGQKSVGPDTRGIFLIEGRAIAGGAEADWSVVLKVVKSPPPDQFVAAPSQSDSYLREITAYRSGEFESPVGGFRSAICYDVEDRPPETWLWLEDLSQAQTPPWSDETYVTVANDIGRFNGYWASRTHPDWDWLSTVDPSFVYHNSGHHKVLTELPAMRGGRIASEAIPRQYFDQLPILWDHGEQIVAALSQLTPSLCHRDSHARNLFPIGDGQGGTLTVAADWASVGASYLGFDAAIVLASGVKSLELPIADAVRLLRPYLAAYQSGLAESGWDGDPERVELGFLMAFATGEATRIARIIHAWDSGLIPEQNQILDADEACAGWSAALPVMIDLSHQAADLARRIQR